jgi:hypothetical protein
MMNNGIRAVFFISAASLLTACAAQAPVKQAVPAAAASNSVPSTADVAAKETIPTTGYRKVVKNGVDYFCSRDTYTGSRVDTTVRCLTTEQLAAIRNGAQDMLRRQQNHVGEQATSANPGGAPYSAASPLP